MSSIIFRNLRPPKTLKTSTSRLLNNTYYSTSVTSKEADEIIIPPRIPRSPTDILEALASTIRRDPTAPHYKYHDDPYLTPMSNYKKRVFALSKESGRKAAHWIRQEHSDLFTQREFDPPLRIKYPYENADPRIEAFLPTMVYNENSSVTEQDLISVMKNNFVTDAVVIYNLLKSKSPESLSPDLEQQFLEFICFHNETNPALEEWQEERWFSQEKFSEKRIKRWKNDSVAMSTFSNMTEKTPAAYCAIIQGMCKHYKADTAYDLYKECQEKGILLNTNVYNGLLSVVGFLKENSEMQFQLITEILQEMKAQNVSPNLRTLNAILESLSLMETTDIAKINCTKVLAEFVDICGIEPSLATWHFVLLIYYKDRSFKSDVLYSIIDKIEGQSFIIRDPKDTLFFRTAMNICRHHLYDVQLAHRIHCMLMNESNYDLIGDGLNESQYYRFYFSLICKNDSFENLMKLYNDLVPHVYVPENSVMLEILNAIDINMATDYYPLIWSHFVMFGLNIRTPLVSSLLESMVKNLPPESEQTDSAPKEDTSISSKEEAVDFNLEMNISESLSALSMEENFARIAWDIWTKNEFRLENGSFWTAGMMSDIVYLLSRSGRIKDSFKIVQQLQRQEVSIGVPSSPDSLIYFSKMAIKYQNPSFATVSLKYLADCGYPQVPDVASEILQTMLNRPKSDIDQLIIEATIKKTKYWTENPTVVKLVEIINQEKSLPNKSKKDNASSSSLDLSSSSSSDSDSDSDDDLKKYIKKEKTPKDTK